MGGGSGGERSVVDGGMQGRGWREAVSDNLRVELIRVVVGGRPADVPSYFVAVPLSPAFSPFASSSALPPARCRPRLHMCASHCPARCLHSDRLVDGSVLQAHGSEPARSKGHVWRWKKELVQGGRGVVGRRWHGKHRWLVEVGTLSCMLPQLQNP
ncbi:hypothetical protein BDW22DRAFT_883352 [Trametopsis cervina]|nr:hypothetical protein BDW22DRAFT_883352 [Trametopsis cervina]